MKASAFIIMLATMTAASTAHADDWKPVEQIKAYPVSGNSGREIYESIGEHGPKTGLGRAVAHTTFKLTWRRAYQPQPDGSCVLAKAQPNLTIIYTLPKAAKKLPPALQANWKTFIDGVERHERVHGEHILDMVRKIEAFSVGLRAENDAGCQKVRAILQKRLGELSNEQRQRSSEFDKIELNSGGNVHQLILALVNGP